MAKITLDEQTAPAAPAAGKGVVYVRNDTPNQLRFIDDAGTDTQLGVGGGGGSTFADNVFRVQDDGDATKEVAFELSGNTTGILGTLATIFTTAKTITFPDVAGTVALTSTAAAAGDISGSLSAGFTIDTDAVTNVMLAEMAANTVKANATAGLADPADVAVGTNTVLGRVGGNIVAAQLATAQIANGAVDLTKIVDFKEYSFLGKDTAGTGDPLVLDETDIATQASASGDFLLGWKSTGVMAKFDAGALPGGGAGNSLDAAYDQGGAAAGRSIQINALTGAAVRLHHNAAGVVEVFELESNPAVGAVNDELRILSRHADTGGTVVETGRIGFIQTDAAVASQNSNIAFTTLFDGTLAEVARLTDVGNFSFGRATAESRVLTFERGASDDTITANGTTFAFNRIVDATTGFRIGGTAASGQFLKGDGTNFIQAGIALDSDTITGTLAVAQGGTNLASGTSGGILGYTATGTLASSALLSANLLVIGGGAGATPSTPVAIGTAGQYLRSGGAATNPAFASITTGELPTAVVLDTESPNAAGDISGDFSAGLTIDTDAVGTAEIDLTISPTWTGAHIFDGASASLEIPNAAGGRTVNVAGEVTVDTTSETLNFHDGTEERVLQPLLYKNITIEDPTSAENITIAHFSFAVTIRAVRSVLVGSATPTVTWNLRHNTDRSLTTANLFTVGPVTTSTTTDELDNTGFNDNTLAAEEFLWFVSTAQGGTVDEIHLSIEYTIDP